MTQRPLMRDCIRERELESGGVYGHVHSDQKYVTITIDFPTFERIRRLLVGGEKLKLSPMPIHVLSPLDVTLSVE